MLMWGLVLVLVVGVGRSRRINGVWDVWFGGERVLVVPGESNDCIRVDR